MTVYRQLSNAIAISLLLIGISPAALANEVDAEASTQQSSNAGTAIKDAWIDGKLESALLFNEHLNSFAIDTRVENGVAFLTGTVESDIDRELAIEIAKSIDGVQMVNSELEVDKDKVKAKSDSDVAKERKSFKDRVSNATLTARIKSQLLLSGNTSGMQIDVDSREGNVTLSGTVDSEQEKDLAERIAGNVSGTRSVENQLTVSNVEEAE